MSDVLCLRGSRTPFPGNLTPKEDVFQLLEPYVVASYMKQIGILRLLCVINICILVSMLSSFSVMLC